jgi:3-hydroxyisobutyrate dehydrogenase-like beta-hydroxyacid dehydrogenase
MTEKIAFIGLGNMGHEMAANLLKAGYELTIYNRTASKARPLTEKGARQAQDAARSLISGGIVVTMLANDQVLEDVVNSEGFLEQLGTGGIHLSMSTISPLTARKLAQLHALHGSIYLASPVFGRPDAAAAAKLFVCLAGEMAAKERVQPVLKAMSQAVFDFGEDVGAANIVKLCGNFLLLSAMEAMAEVFSLAEKSGVDGGAVINMLTQTMFATPAYQNYGRMIAEQRFTPAGFRQVLGLKDINLVSELAGVSAMPMPLASLLHDRLVAGVARGRGELDWSALSLNVMENAGLDVPE